MSNVEQGSGYCGKHRYSINQLLGLSQSVCNPFDLSKFTFDAARAGVIPPLGDCATNSRRTSTARSRIPSTETVSTLDGTMAPRGGNVQEPARPPYNPPEGVLAQQNAGFARFLKKHSSPTHQRVTAGGRIVPIESPIAAPPPFSLDTSRSENQTEKQQQTQSSVNNLKLVPGGEVLSSAQPRSVPSLRLQTMLPAYHLDSLHPATGPLPNQQSNEQLMSPAVHSSMFGESTADQYLPMYGTSNFNSFFPSFMPAQYTGCAPWRPSPMSQGIPLHQNNAAWSHSDSISQFWPQSAVNTQEPLAQQVNYVRNSLETWNSHYNKVDQELKDLDRHRAMTNLNSDIASQRHLLVQQRSDIKDAIDNYKEFLRSHEQLCSTVSQPYPSQTLNIDAPVYVPRGNSTGVSASELGGIQGPAKAPATRDTPKLCGPGPRRPIPIVPPPKLQTNLPPAPPGNDTSPDTPVARDGWGVNIGPAPPEIQQQQKELAESMSRMLSRSSLSNQSRDSLQAAPEGGFFGRSMRGSLQDDDSSSDEEMAQKVRNVFPPSDPGSLQAQQLLDALQKPLGVSTRVKLLNGSYVDVQGQNLQSLPAPITSVFDNDSWSRPNPEPPAWQKNASSYGFGTSRPVKTTPTSHVSSRSQLDHSTWGSSRGSDKENILTRAHRNATTDVSRGQFNNIQSQGQPHSELTPIRPLGGFGKAGQRKELQPIRGFPGAASGAAPGQMSSSIAREMPLYEQFDTNVRYPYFDRFAAGQYQNTEPNQANGSTEWSSDGFTNKGYSSISLQNVHAMAQVPQNMDGPTDNSGRGATSIFSLVGKVRSPRLLRRTTANGGA